MCLCHPERLTEQPQLWHIYDRTNTASRLALLALDIRWTGACVPLPPLLPAKCPTAPLKVAASPVSFSRLQPAIRRPSFPAQQASREQRQDSVVRSSPNQSSSICWRSTWLTAWSNPIVDTHSALCQRAAAGCIRAGRFSATPRPADSTTLAVELLQLTLLRPAAAG